MIIILSVFDTIFICMKLIKANRSIKARWWKTKWKKDFEKRSDFAITYNTNYEIVIMLKWNLQIDSGFVVCKTINYQTLYSPKLQWFFLSISISNSNLNVWEDHDSIVSTFAAFLSNSAPNFNPSSQSGLPGEVERIDIEAFFNHNLGVRPITGSYSPWVQDYC